MTATVTPGTYRWIAVETFRNIDPYEPTLSTVRVKPLPNQGVTTDLRVECSREVRYQYPVGTVFALKAKVIHREDTPLVYSHFSWSYHVLDRKQAEEMIARKELGFFQQAKTHWW